MSAKLVIKNNYSILISNRDSAVGIATVYGLDDNRGRISSPGRVKNFLLSASSRPALGPTQSPIQWVRRALSSEAKRQLKLITHL
jgi:hypothetical protein